MPRPSRSSGRSCLASQSRGSSAAWACDSYSFTRTSTRTGAGRTYLVIRRNDLCPCSRPRAREKHRKRDEVTGVEPDVWYVFKCALSYIEASHVFYSPCPQYHLPAFITVYFFLTSPVPKLPLNCSIYEPPSNLILRAITHNRLVEQLIRQHQPLHQ